MKFLCGSCHTKYQISDEKVRGKILTIRCKKCGAKILVREFLGREPSSQAMIAPVAADAPDDISPTRSGGSAAIAASYELGMEGVQSGESDDMPTSIAPVPSDLGLAGYEWFVAIDGQQHGPFVFAELVAKVQRREIQGRHYVWHDGMLDWARVRSVPDLAPHLTGHGALMDPPPVPLEAEPRQSSMGMVLDFASARGTADLSQSESAIAPEGGEVLLADTDGDEPEALTNIPSVGAEDTGAGGEKALESARALGASLADESLADSDDIFANVPRASAEEVVGAESTKFFVAAAGVPDAAEKIRFWMFLGTAALSAMVVILGLWIVGVLQVSVPGIGNPFAAPRETTAVIQNTSERNDDGNYALLVDGVRIEPIRRRGAETRRKRSSKDMLDNIGQQGYVDTRPSPTSVRGSQRGGLHAVSIDGLDTKLRAPDKLTRFEGPSVDLTVPPPDVEVLDAATIQKVVASKKASVRICYEQSLKAREKLQGKLKLLIEVQPKGKVSHTQIVSPSFKGSVVGKCIQRSIRNWRFPQFRGEPQEIELPFIFQRGS
ncbi:MAG: zinc-ribbon domain-containing protein [Myxococcales bacterium]|nr:zinc-ribbon domain-containing protein [Myxococcales bacterium]